MAALPRLGILGKYFGNAASTGAGFAAGVAVGPALAPEVQSIQNASWAVHAVIPPDAYTLAEGVAQGQINESAAREWAKQTGFGDDQMTALIAIANVGPGEANALDWFHRGIIGEAAFRRALKRLGWEQEWIDDAVAGIQQLLTVDELANAVVQGHMSQDAATAEAEKQGYTADRFDVLVQNTGLPPGPETLLAWARRGIITDGEVGTGIREGHTKVKYIDEYLQAKRVLLSAATAVRAHLKGHITAAEMHQRGQEWGYTPADMDLWYQSDGRPATTHQIHIGYARGASVPGAANEQDAILQAVAQSDVRPEYGPLLYESRYSLPSPFVMRSLTQTGVWSEQKAAQRLREAGWIPQDADEAAAAWAGGTTGSSADSHVTKAQNQLWTATHSSYVKDRTDDAGATTALTQAGVAPASIPQVLATWQAEREIIRGGLSAANIKKAAKEGVFTPDEAVARLVELGWSVADANTYLAL